MTVSSAIQALRGFPGGAEIEGVSGLSLDEASGKVKIEKAEAPKKAAKPERSTEPANGE